MLRIFGSSRSAARKIAEGDSARDRRDWTAAAAAYSAALAINPLNWGIWVQYGHALKESGDIDQAEIAYRRALEIEPDVADTHLQLGHALKLKRDSAGAGAAYLQAARLDPKNRHAQDELRSLGWTSEEVMAVISPPDSLSAEGRPPTRPEATSAAILDQAPFDEKSYLELFGDVKKLIRLGLVDSAEQHFLHYGYREGRDILATFADTPPSRAFILCPSFFKRCGIAEHSRYLADCIERSGLETFRVRTTAEIGRFPDERLRDAVIIVNHGPGLFDGYNPELSEGEATTDVITSLLSMYRMHNARPVVFMHSLLDRDNREMFPRQQLWLESPIPIVTTIEAAGRVFNILRIEHGMQPTPIPSLEGRDARARDYPTIGFFGFYQWGGKNFDALFNVVRRLKGKLVGSVATGGAADVEKLKELIEEAQIRCDLGTGWIEDTDLAKRLSEADYYYLPQHDYDHWNNSGTARLVMNFGRPVILPPANPFLDLRKYAIFAQENDLPALLAWMRDPAVYEGACSRTRAYASRHPMTKEMPALAWRLHEVASKTGARNFIDEQIFSGAALLSAPFEAFSARVAERESAAANLLTSKTLPDSFDRRDQIIDLRAAYPGLFEQDFPVIREIQYWRDHYELEDFFFPSVEEAFVNVFRCLLKREPNFNDWRRFSSILFPSQGAGRRSADATAVLVKNVLALLTALEGVKPNLEFAPAAQIYSRNARVGARDFSRPELVDEIVRTWSARLGHCATLGHPEGSPRSALELTNIIQILMLPGEWVENILAARVGASPAQREVFRQVGRVTGPCARYRAAMRAFETIGAKMSEVVVIDRPVVAPVDFQRREYSIADFWPFEGDAFIFHLVRCLSKRNPFPPEMFYLSERLQKDGKLSVIRELAQKPYLNAVVVDLQDSDIMERLDRDLPEIDVLVSQFRSPHAGGWDLRNAYLEASREFDRAWLRMKNMKDMWWAQSNCDVSAICAIWERTNTARARRELVPAGS